MEETGRTDAEGSPVLRGLREVRGWLTAQDVTVLTDDERLDLLSELELLTRAAAGLGVRTQVAFHASQVGGQVAAGVAPSRAGRAVPDDLARARRTSPWWGSRELSSAKALVVEMPCTLRALERGEISLLQSRLVTEATTCLAPEDRAEVDRRLAPALAGASTREMVATARGLVYEVDPRGFVERARRAAADRGVSIRPCPDVMALLGARLPAVEAIACHAALRRRATSMRASGDPRSQAQLMADLLVERLTGRSVVDGVDVEVGVVMTSTALFEGTSEAADLVGFGPVPAELARELLREPGAGRDTTSTTSRDPSTPHHVCPEGGRCTDAACDLVHGCPEATPPPPAPSSRPIAAPVAPPAARVWLRRLWVDPATGVLTGRDTRRRLFTGALRAALVARDRTCRNAWCGAPVRALDHRTRARDGGATSATNGQGLCQRCNGAREHPRAALPAVEDYRPPPPLLPAFLADRSPPADAAA